MLGYLCGWKVVDALFLQRSARRARFSYLPSARYSTPLQSQVRAVHLRVRRKLQVSAVTAPLRYGEEIRDHLGRGVSSGDD